MKKLLYLFCLLFALPVTQDAQSLYHDALKLSEIIREDQARQSVVDYSTEPVQVLINRINPGLVFYPGIISPRAARSPRIEWNGDGVLRLFNLAPDSGLVLDFSKTDQPDSRKEVIDLNSSYVEVQHDRGQGTLTFSSPYGKKTIENIRINSRLNLPLIDEVLASDSLRNDSTRLRQVTDYRLFFTTLSEEPLRFLSVPDPSVLPVKQVIEQVDLSAETRYHFFGLNLSDTLYLLDQFQEQEILKARLFFSAPDELTILQPGTDPATLTITHGLILDNTIEKVTISTPEDQQVSILFPGRTGFDGRKVINRPQPGRLSLNNEARRFPRNRLPLQPMGRYNLQCLDAGEYRVHLLHGKEKLRTYQLTDQIGFFFDQSSQTIQVRYPVKNGADGEKMTRRIILDRTDNARVTFPVDEDQVLVSRYDNKYFLESDELDNEVPPQEKNNLDAGLWYNYVILPGEEQQLPFRIEVQDTSFTTENRVFEIFSGESKLEITYTPVYITRTDRIIIRDPLNVSSILGAHTNILSRKGPSLNLLADITASYQRNPFLRRYLTPYLEAPAQFRLQQESALLDSLDTRLKFAYPWEEVLYGSKKLDLDNRVSYKELVNTYRNPINSASDNLLAASEKFNSESAKMRQGLSATTLAAGLSDFIVERAQEELNLTFLNRLKKGILSDTSELGILFPSTSELLTQFDITHYRSFLQFSKTTFTADLQDLGLNFPRLLNLPKYTHLKNDPEIFTLFLIYDIANKVYEDTPVDTIMLHVHSRVLERQRELNKEINQTLAAKLLRAPAGSPARQELNTLQQQVRNYLADLDRIEKRVHQLKTDQVEGRILADISTVMEELDNTGNQKEPLEKRLTAIENDLGKVATRYQFVPEEAAEDAGPDAIRETDRTIFAGLEGQSGSMARFNEDFQKFKVLTPEHLKGKPVYWYALDRLSPAEYETYFSTPPNPEGLAAAGLDMTRSLLRSNQEGLRQGWVDLLEQQLRELEKQRIAIEQIQSKENLDLSLFYPLLTDFNTVVKKRLLLLAGLRKERAFLQGTYQLTEHDCQSLVYLEKVLQTPGEYTNLFNWNKIDELTSDFQFIPSYDTFFGEGMSNAEKQELFLKVEIQADNPYAEIANAKIFLDSLTDTATRQIRSLRQKYGVVEDEAYLQEVSAFYADVNRIDPESSLLLDYSSFLEDFDLPQVPCREGTEPAKRKVITTVQGLDNPLFLSYDAIRTETDKIQTDKIAAILASRTKGPVDELEGVITESVIELERLKGELYTSRLRADSINRFLVELENEYCDTLVRARQSAENFAQLLEFTIHWMYALQDNSVQVVERPARDSVVRRVTVTIPEETGGAVREIAYDSVQVQPVHQKITKKWLNKQQFDAVMKDTLTRDVFLGLLYQRLSSLNDAPGFTSQGLALASTKLVDVVYDIDNLRDTLQQKRRTNQAITFRDYYPFIRTAVDLMNVVITTPTSGQSSLGDQLSGINQVPVISDKALSLFENVFAENYGDAIRNATDILSILWKVDARAALEDYRRSNQALVQSTLTATDTTTNKGLNLLGKKNKPQEVDLTENLSKEERKVLQQRERSNHRLKNALLVYGTFMANMATAQTSNDVKNALQAAAMPPGSSSVKRESTFNVSINGYFGAGYWREKLTSNQITSDPWGSTFSLTVPIGVAASVGLGRSWSVSFFAPILDVGAVTAFRLDQDNLSSELPELSFSNIIAPGGYLVLNFPRTPFSLGAGAQYGPQTRTVMEGDLEISTSAWRWGAFLAIDVPIFNLYNGARILK